MDAETTQASRSCYERKASLFDAEFERHDCFDLLVYCRCVVLAAVGDVGGIDRRDLEDTL